LFQYDGWFKTKRQSTYFTVIIERRDMSRESTEELRQRLLRDKRVQELISRRAYEIYVMRGGQPGGEAHDWFQAESEILPILIEEESRRAGEKSATAETRDEVNSASPVAKALGIPETADRTQQAQGLTAEEQAESQSAIGAWSAAEPASAERAPEIGAADLQTGATATKKARLRNTAKSAAPRKSKSSSEKPASAKEPAAKKTASKRTAPKEPGETKRS
jgi:hypothetical protein